MVGLMKVQLLHTDQKRTAKSVASKVKVKLPISTVK